MFEVTNCDFKILAVYANDVRHCTSDINSRTYPNKLGVKYYHYSIRVIWVLRKILNPP